MSVNALYVSVLLQNSTCSVFCQCTYMYSVLLQSSACSVDALVCPVFCCRTLPVLSMHLYAQCSAAEFYLFCQCTYMYSVLLQSSACSVDALTQSLIGSTEIEARVIALMSGWQISSHRHAWMFWKHSLLPNVT